MWKVIDNDNDNDDDDDNDDNPESSSLSFFVSSVADGMAIAL